MIATEPSGEPRNSSYDVVIVGGAMFGSSVAWFLASNPDFDGSILVVEKDPSYEFTSTAHTNSCMRQQFSREITRAHNSYIFPMKPNANVFKYVTCHGNSSEHHQTTQLKVLTLGTSLIP